MGGGLVFSHLPCGLRDGIINPRTQEAVAGGSVSLKSVWCTEGAPCWPGLPTESPISEKTCFNCICWCVRICARALLCE